jgi:DNA-binding transcriptional regulator YhcF (GntR family)
MEFNMRIPIYLQIIDKIKKDIILGKINTGDKLPSVRSMASDLKVNVNTIQRVYQELEREGVTYTQRGIGSFISENEEIIQKIRSDLASEILESFINGMKELGYSNAKILDYVTKCLKED